MRSLASTTDDLIASLDMIKKNRTSAATAMNPGTKQHDGSSRSHACQILTLHQNVDGIYQKSEFHLVDLAGAERPEKVGTRKSAMDVLTSLYVAKSTAADLADQGMMINWELHEFATTIVQAADSFKQKIQYSQPQALASQVIQYLTHNLNSGKSLGRAIVTLSQAPQNGWETWFSLEYGMKLSALRANVKRLQGKGIKALVDSTRKELQGAVKAAEEAERNRTKFMVEKRAMATQIGHQLRVLEEIAGAS